ncbi:MAG: regulatory protein TetR [Acidimicrobiales bacterium]|jgi:AcrR family transcriptional regulator|nr:regulatory protein TetR [Acidimicrobiales bacterium]
MDAAVECILEEGFYRASSNKIARHAGVSWGVIQYYFGSREQLMLAVVHRSADDLVAALSDAVVAGDTFRERLASLADTIWSHYRRPEFLVVAQIILNLSHDPNSAAETVDTISKLNGRVARRWQRLVDQVVEPSRQQPGLSGALFEIVRGVAIGAELVDAFPGVRRARGTPRDPEREVLLRALTSLFAPDELPE